MKFVFILTAIFIGFLSCKNNVAKSVEAKRDQLPANEKKIIDSLYKDSSAVFVWVDSLRTLQPLKDGEVINTTFKFKNGGNTPLIIKSVGVSCGCTKTNYPENIIKPNEDGLIEVTFDSKGKGSDAPDPSPLEKSITVYANTLQQTHAATFKVVVKK